MHTHPSSSPTSVLSSRQGLKQISVGVVTLILATALGVTIWSGRGPVVTRSQPSRDVQRARVVAVQGPDYSGKAAPVVFLAASAEAAGAFQAGLLQVTDGSGTTLAGRVVPADTVQSVRTENVWREANGVPVLRLVDLAAETATSPR